MSDTISICALEIIAEICFDDGEIVHRRKRRFWMKKWFQNRMKYSNVRLLKELKKSQPEDFMNYLRMDSETFEILLQKVKPLIVKQDTIMRDAITPETRLSITLRFLANGNSFEDLKFFYATSPQCLGRIVIETSEAIAKVLKDYIKLPSSSDEWKLEAEKFQLRSGFPQCIGAIDGKHVLIKKPPKSGSFYFNYKKTFSVVLMAVVNSNSEFLFVDVGTNGRISDGGVLLNTKWYTKLIDKQLHIPDAEVVNPTNNDLPYVFVGDDAFALRKDLMKPFNISNLSKKQEVFNKKISSARVKVENAFGILAAMFRILLTTIALCPEKTTKIVLACCYLHNFLKKRRGIAYSQMQAVSQDSEELLMELESSSARNSSREATDVRNKFCEVVNILNDN